MLGNVPSWDISAGFNCRNGRNYRELKLRNYLLQVDFPVDLVGFTCLATLHAERTSSFWKSPPQNCLFEKFQNPADT